MNAYDRSYERIKAVQKSAELLRDLGTAFFPLDVIGALSAFGKQINLVQYAHCHGENRFHDSIEGRHHGIMYRLVSGDYLKWMPEMIL